MSGPTSYDDDIYAWAFQQAQVLRRLSEMRLDLPKELDLENLSEEIEGVARAELRAAESLLQQLFGHLLKLVSSRDSSASRLWRGECEILQIDFTDSLTRSMESKVQLDRCWRQSALRTRVTLEKEGGALLPGIPQNTCPLTLDMLAAPTFDIDGALARIRESAAAPAQPAP